MREVELSRFVRATPQEVRRALTPAAMVEYEGSFAVREVREGDDATHVVAGARGLEFVLRFETFEDGVRYEQAGEAGPFDAMSTIVRVAAENEGSRVTATSSVSLGLPVPLADRVAAWKRKGELERALANLDEAL